MVRDLLRKHADAATVPRLEGLSQDGVERLACREAGRAQQAAHRLTTKSPLAKWWKSRSRTRRTIY